MNKYYIYRDNDYLVCEKRDEKGNNEAINDLDKFNCIVDNFIEEGYQITIKNNDLILIGNQTSFCINNFMEIIDCNYLKKLQDDIIKTFKEKGVSEWQEEKSLKTSDKKRAINKLRRIKTIGFNFAVVATMFASTLIVKPQVEKVLNQPIKLCKPRAFSTMVEVAENNEKILKLQLEQDDKEVLIDNHKQINVSITTADEECFSNEGTDEDKNLVDEDTTNLEEDLIERVYYFDGGHQTAYNHDVNLTTPDETFDEAAIYDNYIATYAGYYHFDVEKVIDIAHKMTNNYEIPLQDVNNTDQYDMNSQEAAALMFVSQLKRNKLAVSCREYGYDSSDDLLIDDSVEKINSNLILSSGYSFSEYVGKIADLLQIDKNYALAISYSEAGRDTDSVLARTKNNFGGIRGNGEFITYPTPEAGIIGFCRTLKKFESYNFNDIEDFCLIYVNYYSQNWIDNVKYIHDEVEKNSNLFFGNDQKKERRRMPGIKQKTLIK